MKYAVGGLVTFEEFEKNMHVYDDFMSCGYMQEIEKMYKEIIEHMEIKELREKLSEQAFKLKKARANGTTVMQETERMKNLLVNNCDAIVEALTRVEKLEQEIAVLNMELDDAERELDEAKGKKYAGMPGDVVAIKPVKIEKKTTTKKKTTSSAEADE